MSDKTQRRIRDTAACCALGEFTSLFKWRAWFVLECGFLKEKCFAFPCFTLLWLHCLQNLSHHSPPARKADVWRLIDLLVGFILGISDRWCFSVSASQPEVSSSLYPDNIINLT